MAMHCLYNQTKKKGKQDRAKTKRKGRKRQQKKEEMAQNVVIEGSEFLNKEQLKKVSKHPTNNIRASGKRKRKMMKRLKHSQKEKNQMDVEVASGSGSKDKVTDKATEKVTAMDTDEGEESST